MGRQVQFFADRDDFRLILDFCRNQGDSLLTESAERADHAYEARKLYIWKEGFIIRREKDYFNNLDSEVIELTRGHIDFKGKVIFPGRLYIQTYQLDGDKLLPKNPELVKKYDLYKRFILKTFRKSKNRFICYIGPSAYKLYKQGWKMMQGPIVEMHFD